MKVLEIFKSKPLIFVSNLKDSKTQSILPRSSKKIPLSDQKSVKKLDELVISKDIKLLELPPKLFDPYRFLIMKILHAQGPVGFSELKQDLSLSDGNLANHLHVLEDTGYITSQKEFRNKKPRTTYDVTPEGQDGFSLLKERLKVLVNEY